MAECAICKKETFMYAAVIPICIQCLEKQAVALPHTEREIRAALVNRIIDATLRTNAASEAFSAVTSQFPSGLPHPDGVQRIKTAASELSSARMEMIKAHRRLNEFIERGTVPEDLKGS